MTNKRPAIVGITCLDDRPVQDQYAPRFSQNQTYVHAVARAGAVPLLIPQLADRALLRSLYELLDGLLLSGGEDVDPAYYGEPRHEKCGRVSPGRDDTELTLIRWAVDDEKPLLAICRGIQVLNVALGGSLYQDIRAQVPGADEHDWYPGYPRDHLSHMVIIAPQTRLAQVLGMTSLRLGSGQALRLPLRLRSGHGSGQALRPFDWAQGKLGSGQALRQGFDGLSPAAQDTALPVNSMHHQAIKDVAPGLIVAAQAPDEIVEAVEVEGHPFALGIQWHPEELAENDARAQRIFGALVEVCQGGKMNR